MSADGGWEPQTRLGTQVAEGEIESMTAALNSGLPLKELRADGTLDRTQYRALYDKASGGEFDSVADLERYIDENYGEI